MNSDRIKEIQQGTAYPDSVSVKQALLQVWNECEQERSKFPLTKDELRRELIEYTKYIFEDTPGWDENYWLVHQYLKQLPDAKGREEERAKRIFSVTFRGKDEQGEIIKGIDVVAESSEQAMDLIKQVSNSREIYSAIEVNTSEQSGQ